MCMHSCTHVITMPLGKRLSRYITANAPTGEALLQGCGLCPSFSIFLQVIQNQISENMQFLQ